MKITELYKDYFQKSRVFVYPALGIRRGASVTPEETFMSWEGYFSVKDTKFCCLYTVAKTHTFQNFEKTKLLVNPRFYDVIKVDDERAVYVFDYQDMIEDWNHIVKGKYSKISKEHKTKIRQYIGLTSGNLPYIDSFLYPEKFFPVYSILIDVNEKLLRDVGELCDKPDFEKETLKIEALQC